MAHELHEQAVACNPFGHVYSNDKPPNDHQEQQYKCIIALQICDALEDQMTVGGNIIDFHSCDFFPERWFDLVIVLQTDNTILYDRLEKR